MSHLFGLSQAAIAQSITAADGTGTPITHNEHLHHPRQNPNGRESLPPF
ncbi:hypothetical protein [Spirulina major]|nr:hypothetical protein [Spirulina major]